jgi:hypothetical protein
MALDINDMITGVRRVTGEDTDDISDADVTLILNESWWEIMDKFNFREKETTGFEDTVIGQAEYPAPTPFEAIRQISIQDINTLQHYKLERMLPADYESYLNDDPSQQDFPTRYVREGCLFRLWPTPDNVYPLTIKYLTVLPDLSQTLFPNPPIPQVWGEVIKMGGIWRRFRDIGDITRMTTYINVQTRLLNSTSPVETKEEYDSREARLEVQRGDVGWFSSYNGDY